MLMMSSKYRNGLYIALWHQNFTHLHQITPVVKFLIHKSSSLSSNLLPIENLLLFGKPSVLVKDHTNKSYDFYRVENHHPL